MSDPVIKYIVRRGEQDPKRIRIRIDATSVATADRVISDLTAVTSVDLDVRDMSSGATETWSTVLFSQSVSLLVVDHALQLADTASLRTLHVAVWMNATGAAHRVFCGAFELQVVEP